MIETRRPAEHAHPVDQVPPARELLLFGLQHLLVMYSGVIAVPYVIGKAMGLGFADIAYLVSANSLIAGLGTVLTTVGFWRFGARLPILLGPSANVIAPVVLIGHTQGLATVWGACILAGVGMMLVAPIIRSLTRFFPSVVMGTMLATLGIMLIPVGVKIIGLYDASKPLSGDAMAMVFMTIAIIAVLIKILPSAFRQAALLIGIVVATAIAALMGKVDFSHLGDSGYIGIATPFHFGLPAFDLAAAIPVLIITLVLTVESMSLYVAVGELVGLEDPLRRIGDGVRADGLATFVGGIMGAYPLVTFSQNIGVLGMVKTKSRYVATVAGLLLMLAGIFPWVGQLAAAVPGPVLGAAALVMFASVGVAGIKILARVDFGRIENLFIVATSLGLGLIPMAFPNFYANWPGNLRVIVDSPVGMGALAAVLLNLLFNRWPGSSHQHAAASEGTRGEAFGERLNAAD